MLLLMDEGEERFEQWKKTMKSGWLFKFNTFFHYNFKMIENYSNQQKSCSKLYGYKLKPVGNCFEFPGDRLDKKVQHYL